MEHLRPVNSVNSSALSIGRRKAEEKYVLFMLWYLLEIKQVGSYSQCTSKALVAAA